MRKLFIAALIVGLYGGDVFAQATARQETLTTDTRQSANLTVNHKAYSAIQFNGVVTDSVAQAAVNITGKTGTIGFKESLSDTAFFAEKAITILVGASGTWTATLPAAQWATNILVKTRFYGDLRLSDFGAPLPSIDLWLYPSANVGTESNYVSPTTAGFETNYVLVENLERINFSTGIVSTVTTNGGTNRLTVTVEFPAETDPVWRTDSNNVVHTNTPIYTNAIELAGSALQSGDFTQDGGILVGTAVAGVYAEEVGATARASLGVAIGSDVQAYSANLTPLSANNASALTNITFPVQISWHLERPTNATYAVKWFDCASSDISLTRLMGKTEAGTIQGHIIEQTTNDAWNVFTTNLTFSIGVNGTSFNSYTDWVDGTIEQSHSVGWIITNDVTGVTNTTCTLHGSQVL